MRIQSAFEHSDFAIKDVREIRSGWPVLMARYLDHEIMEVYHQYCEENHASAWTRTDLSAFVKWATQSPLELAREK